MKRIIASAALGGLFVLLFAGLAAAQYPPAPPPPPPPPGAPAPTPPPEEVTLIVVRAPDGIVEIELSGGNFSVGDILRFCDVDGENCIEVVIVAVDGQTQGAGAQTQGAAAAAGTTTSGVAVQPQERGTLSVRIPAGSAPTADAMLVSLTSVTGAGLGTHTVSVPSTSVLSFADAAAVARSGVGPPRWVALLALLVVGGAMLVVAARRRSASTG